jgi:hypothetical protein
MTVIALGRALKDIISLYNVRCPILYHKSYLQYGTLLLSTGSLLFSCDTIWTIPQRSKTCGNCGSENSSDNSRCSLSRHQRKYRQSDDPFLWSFVLTLAYEEQCMLLLRPLCRAWSPIATANNHFPRPLSWPEFRRHLSILSSPYSSYAPSDPPLHHDILHALTALLTEIGLALLDIDLVVLHFVHRRS